MDTILNFGLLAALLIGLILGLIGGGGSIVTVPVLVYLIGIDAITATAYSLFLVGVSAAVGAYKNALQGNVNFKIGLIFSIPAFTAVYLTRAFMIPALPDVIATFNGFVLTRELGIMVFFALIMLVASVSMIKTEKNTTPVSETKLNIPLVILEGGIVGVVTGLVGAGGGFLIIPALVLLAGLEIKVAIGTSLFIIAIKSMIGFLGDVTNTSIDWPFLLTFTAFAVGGIFIGLAFNKRVPSERLKKIFGWFVLLMGISILFKEIVL